MALAVVTTAMGGAATGLGTIFSVPAMNTVAGNLLVVWTRVAAATTVSTPTDTAGNTYVPLPPQTAASTNFQFWYAKNCLGNNSNVISIVLTPSTTFTAAFAWQISGADLTAPFDLQVFGTGASGSTGTTSPFSTAFTNEIILMCVSDTINQTFVQGAGYTLDSAQFPAAAGAQYCGSQHLIVAALQSGVTASMTWTTSGAWQAHAVTFKDANQPAVVGTGGYGPIPHISSSVGGGYGPTAPDTSTVNGGYGPGIT